MTTTILAMRHILLAAASLLLVPAVQAQTAPPPVATIPAGRLSDAVAPKAYRLDLSIDPNQPRFSGRVEIDAQLKQASTAIFLHGNGLTVHKASATVAGRTVAAQWRQVDDSGVAELTFAEALPAGPVTLAFAYDAAFNDGPAGLFRVKVGEDWYSWSQFQSIDARAAFPSFDQPSFKTPFTVTLRTPPGLVAVSNAPQVSQKDEGGQDVHRFAPTLPLPTYLVAMMVGPFATVEGTVAATPQREKPLPLRVISPRPNGEKLDFALQGSKEIVALLEDYFADAFPYPKLDQITSPIMPGAMENAGADLYDDGIIVMDANAPTPRKRRFGMVVSHELAHQWFGDLVTPAWWDDIWLNESFANWMGYRIGDAWRPDLNLRSGALADGFKAMETDALIAGRPIRQPIETNAQINAAFDSITYGKGGHVVAMIAAFMGDTKFRDGVRRYMAAHRFANATSIDFFAAMAEAAGDPRFVPAMRSFTDQQGVPLLTFAAAGESGGYTVRQSRYAAYGANAPAQSWGIPLCVRRDDVRQCQLLTDESGSIAIAGAGPLVPNADGAGYYRFELPAGEWNALIARADKLNGGEALALVDSLSASVWADRASVTQLAELARRLVPHKDSYAAEAGVQALARLVSAGFAGESGRSGWRRLVRRAYEPLLTHYGFDPRAGFHAGDDAERSQRRVQIVERLVSTARDKGLRKQLDGAVKRYLAGDVSALDPAWFDAAFGVYLGEGGLERAKALTERALASEDPQFRPEALDAVGGSNSTAVVRWVLEDLRDPRLRPSEKRDMLNAIMQSGATRELGYDWMHANLDQLLAGAGIFFSSRLPQMLARFCSVERAEQFAQDLRPRLAGTSAALELERVVERVSSCGQFRKARGAAIAREFAGLK